MPLEATMIVVDNSESSRNGDYLPSRWGAQVDVINKIFDIKIDANPESSVGLISMGGRSPELLTTLTTDRGKLLEGIHRTKIGGDIQLATGLQIASLALQHRQNKSQRQRIIAVVCSPIPDKETDLVKLAKKMKKNGVSVDFVAFGDIAETNTKKLSSFNAIVTGGDGSHLEVIPPSAGLLSDILPQTPILSADIGIPRGGEGFEDGGQDTSQFEFGVNPDVDPELALALRLSMEEAKAREEKEKGDDAKKSNLETVKEEEERPLLQDNGEPSGSGSGSGSGKKEKDEDDKMDTS